MADDRWPMTDSRVNRSGGGPSKALMMRELGREVAYAARGLRQAPAVTFFAVLTLTLGIGATTAIFSVVNAAMLRPLPFPDASRLVFLWNTTPDGDPNPLAPARMLDVGREMTSFDGYAGIAHIGLTLTGGGEPELLRGSTV